MKNFVIGLAACAVLISYATPALAAGYSTSNPQDKGRYNFCAGYGEPRPDIIFGPWYLFNNPCFATAFGG